MTEASVLNPPTASTTPLRTAHKANAFNVLPGFRWALAWTLVWLAVIVLVPVSAVFLRTADAGAEAFWHAVASPRVLASLKLSFGAALIAAAVNAVFGLLLAWVLVRYRFPGRRLVDALVDLPIALPTAVAGIALTALYAPKGWIGQWLSEWGLKVAFTPLGVVLALIFVGLPFVVRTLQPVLQELSREQEEAAATLGATPAQTFLRVTLPALLPALLTGFTLAFARGVGEYGSVIFIAGNMPMVSEIAPLMIVSKLEQFDYTGATSIALVMLMVSFALLLLINHLQGRLARRRGQP